MDARTAPLERIQRTLNSPRLRESLTDLFCNVLFWGRPQGTPQPVQVGAPVGRTLTVNPVALLSGLPVLRLDWPEDRLPTITQRRAVQKALAPTALEHLLCYVTQDGRQAAFVWARRRGDRKVELRTLPYEVGAPARTTVERLGKLAFTVQDLGLYGEPGIGPLTDRLNGAFDVQAVTDDFFGQYQRCFEEEVKPAVRKVLPDEAEAHAFTQILFNRLMFCWFLQKKGWLGGRPDYLLHLMERAHGTQPPRNLYHDYLSFLFFNVLCNPEEERRKRQPTDPHVSWEAPFLNGGLFERTPLDERVDARPRALPNSVLESILAGLFAPHNFTVEESTALDVAVALDPELLGTIFERLVTGRHETGSYYTPRPVVEFMCREALAAHLTSALPQLGKPTVEALVFEHDLDALSPADTPDLIRALDDLKVCDPACGSGAYLVTMLHELVALYRSLYSEKMKDPQKDYDLKLRIIQRNLYGVDLAPFAVNIARLRLWLTLIVDSEETDWRRVKPLPNLDFRIEPGDSLTAPNPQGVPDLFRHAELPRIERLGELKGAYLRAHGERKKQLAAQIDTEEAALRRALADVPAPEGSLDWRIAFAEVFVAPQPERTMDGRFGFAVEAMQQPPLYEQPTSRPGFDIVLANPPYVRHELLGRDYKENALKPVFRDVYSGTADLYVYFYARADQLLHSGGIGCFISSNKWLRVNYGEKLRECLLDHEAVNLIVDFGELPVFDAATFPAICLWAKRPRGATPTCWTVVKDLPQCYEEGVLQHIRRVAVTVPASHFGRGKARLMAPDAADRRRRMESSGPTLGEYVGNQTFFGIKTGYNDAFVVDQATRDELVANDPGCERIIKPLICGDDVRRYEKHDREQYLLYIGWHTKIRDYPSVLHHLEAHRSALKRRPEAAAGRHPWYALTRYAADYAHLFDQPKILVPAFAMTPRFAMDEGKYTFLAPAYFISSGDPYLLGVLNSSPAFNLLLEICSVLGDQEAKGRAVLRPAYFARLPIPQASSSDRAAVVRLVEQTSDLHTRRRQLVEVFLRDIGISPARSSSRNPLEEPWKLTPEILPARFPRGFMQVFVDARDETAALTEEIEKVEREIDERVAALYGL